jgi:uncharacterized membrane protein YkoI
MFALVGLVAAVFPDDTPEAMRALLDRSKISLADAIAKAQEQAPGGALMEIELESDDGEPVFEIEFFTGDNIKQVKIDAASGEVRRVRNKVLPDNLMAQTLERGKAIRDATGDQPLDHAAALEAAAHATGGRPFEIQMKVRGNMLVYDVRTVTEQKLREAMIAADTHEVLRVQDREKR